MYNPGTKVIEWRISTYKSYDVDGVYNPDTKSVELKQGEWPRCEIAGAYDPNSKEVEWYQSSALEYSIDAIAFFE